MENNKLFAPAARPGAAILWSTGGLFIKATHLSAFELSFRRSLLAAITIAILTRGEGFGINKITAITSILYAALLILFVAATKLTTAANAIFLQYTAPVYVLILEPLFYKEKFRLRDLATSPRASPACRFSSSASCGPRMSAATCWPWRRAFALRFSSC
jgi:drug/metabolite transporter (DMT)-like permease